MRDIAERFAAAINARSAPADLFHAEFRVENVETAVTDAVYAGGPDAYRRWLADLLEAFGDDARFEHEIVAEADDRAVAHVRMVGRGSASGAPLDLRWAAVLESRDGRLLRAAGFASRREALAEAGLELPT